MHYRTAAEVTCVLKLYVDIWWLNRKLSFDVCLSPNNRSLIWGFFKVTVHFEEPRESKIHKRNSLFWYILTLPFHRRNLYTPTEGVLIPIFNISGTILSLLILILGRLVTIHSLGSWNPNFPSVHCWYNEVGEKKIFFNILVEVTFHKPHHITAVLETSLCFHFWSFVKVYLAEQCRVFIAQDNHPAISPRESIELVEERQHRCNYLLIGTYNYSVSKWPKVRKQRKPSNLDCSLYHVIWSQNPKYGATTS